MDVAENRRAAFLTDLKSFKPAAATAIDGGAFVRKSEVAAKQRGGRGGSCGERGGWHGLTTRMMAGGEGAEEDEDDEGAAPTFAAKARAGKKRAMKAATAAAGAGAADDGGDAAERRGGGGKRRKKVDAADFRDAAFFMSHEKEADPGDAQWTRPTSSSASTRVSRGGGSTTR